MRYLSYFLVLLLCTNCKKQKTEFTKAEIIPSTIDSLNSEQSVEQYIRQFREPLIKNFQKEHADSIHNFLEKFELKKIKEFDRDSRFDIDSITKRIADSLNITKSYYKKDLDNNGYTDLLIIGDNKGCNSFGMSANSSRSCDFSVYTLMNFGKDSILPIDLMVRAQNNSIVPKITEINNIPIIEIHQPGEYHWIEKRKITKNKKVELIFKFNSFIEYNENPKKYNIKKIEFQNEVTRYKYPHFEITINNDRKALINAKSGNSIYENTDIYYNDTIPEFKGKFKSNIKKKDYDQIINLLNYIDFPNLKNRYTLRRMHTYNCTLKITYGNGQIKTIEDYGMFGSYGLKKVYDILFDLRFNQEWN